VLRGRAARGKTSVAGSLGCKLHRVVKEPGEWRTLPITPGNPDARQPVADGLPALDGKVFADRGRGLQSARATAISDRWHRVLGPPQTQQEQPSDAAH
jgi:hypothetical protein